MWFEKMWALKRGSNKGLEVLTACEILVKKQEGSYHLRDIEVSETIILYEY
jgi:hypothetical protein